MAENKIVDCNNATISYIWNMAINRIGGKNGRTENNNALLKLNPKFASDIQKVNATLTSDENIKKFICEILKIPFTNEYMHFSHLPYIEEVKKEKVQEIAKADKSENAVSQILELMKIKQIFEKEQIAKCLVEHKIEYGITENMLKNAEWKSAMEKVIENAIKKHNENLPKSVFDLI